MNVKLGGTEKGMLAQQNPSSLSPNGQSRLRLEEWLGFKSHRVSTHYRGFLSFWKISLYFFQILSFVFEFSQDSGVVEDSMSNLS